MSIHDELYADMIGGWRVANGPGAEEDDTQPELPADDEDEEDEEDHVMGIEESAAIASAVRASGGSTSDVWDALQVARRTMRRGRP